MIYCRFWRFLLTNGRPFQLLLLASPSGWLYGRNSCSPCLILTHPLLINCRMGSALGSTTLLHLPHCGRFRTPLRQMIKNFFNVNPHGRALWTNRMWSGHCWRRNAMRDSSKRFRVAWRPCAVNMPRWLLESWVWFVLTTALLAWWWTQQSQE